MKLRIEYIDGKKHLIEEKFARDEDLGELYERFDGKLETRNIFGKNFVLKDKSGLLSEGDIYEITDSSGGKGTMKKSWLHDHYDYKEKKQTDDYSDPGSYVNDSDADGCGSLIGGLVVLAIIFWVISKACDTPVPQRPSQVITPKQSISYFLVDGKPIIKSSQLGGYVKKLKSGNRVNIRQNPSTNASVIGYVVSGDLLRIEENGKVYRGLVNNRTGNWLKVSNKINRTGYIAKSLIEVTARKKNKKKSVDPKPDKPETPNLNIQK
jgi:hypothetical protein